MDSELYFRDHISDICKTASQKVGGTNETSQRDTTEANSIYIDLQYFRI